MFTSKKFFSQNTSPDLILPNTTKHFHQKSPSPQSINTKTFSSGNTGKKTVSYFDTFSFSTEINIYNNKNKVINEENNNNDYNNKRHFLTKKLINNKSNIISPNDSMNLINSSKDKNKKLVNINSRQKVSFYNSGKFNLPFLSYGN